MAEGTRRRSARLLALQEPKNQKKPFGTNMLDDEKAAKNPQQVDPSNNGNSSENSCAPDISTNVIIDSILDVFQVNDTKELFAMPNNIQITDYSEMVNNPGDFATLRQKLKDGMYQTLEQFADDVYKVFRKAINSNPQDSLRMKEAAYQKESAKNLFQSLKNSREHILLDISAWHQKYFGYTKRTNSNYRKKQYSRSISKKTPNSSAIPSSMPKESVEGSEFCEEQQTNSNNTMSNLSIPVSMHPTQIVYNNNTSGFTQSLMHFVKDANYQSHTSSEQPNMENGQEAGYLLPLTSGLHNQMGNANFSLATFSNPFNYSFNYPLNVADFSGNNAEASWYIPLLNPTHFWSPYFLTPTAGGTGSASFNTMQSSIPSMNANSMPGSNVLYGPNSNLDNDSLLMLPSSVSTPESLGKGKNISVSSSSQAIEPNMIADKGKSPLPYQSQAIEPKSHFNAFFSLGVEGRSSMRRVEPSHVDANLVTSEQECSKGKDTVQSSSVYDSVPCPLGSTGTELNPSSTSTDPNKPRTLNLFGGPK
ncbi:uncharacterized protein LOC109708486 isoform X2 [Ananas comosus]|uniref:Uncharacterized protein LOC109708486 isoform X2 n=1 Tax=Ananas comosus TaxID=4615 RepID=A0A6P5EXG5_ANACO|nr:uncharacterized protein LOC109708486 isoform X2 [Ananas comosus]